MLKIEKEGNVSIVRFDNDITRLNLPISQQLKENLQDVFLPEGCCVILSLAGIKFIDSSGFALLISTLKTSRNNNCTLKLSDINTEVMELVKLMQLHNIFEIYPTIKDALNSCKG